MTQTTSSHPSLATALTRAAGYTTLAFGAAVLAANLGKSAPATAPSQDPSDPRTVVQATGAARLKAACEAHFPAAMHADGKDPDRLMVMNISAYTYPGQPPLGGRTQCTANVAAGKYGVVNHSYFLPPEAPQQ